MLKKLLKHELHATGRHMWIVYLAMVLLIIGEAVTTHVIGSNLLAMEDEPVLMVILTFALVIGFVAIGAAIVLTIALMVHRFYKNYLSDEGYLMFTLPVNVHQLVWSKLLVAVLWMTITILLAVVGIVLSGYNLISGASALLGPGSLSLDMLFGDLEINLPLAVVQVILSGIVSCGVSVLSFYCVMAIGYGFAKNKALMSVLIYFGIQFGISLISGGVSVVSMIAGGDAGMMESVMDLTYAQQWHFTMLGSLALSLVMGAAYYAVTIWNLKKRLNLS